MSVAVRIRVPTWVLPRKVIYLLAAAARKIKEMQVSRDVVPNDPMLRIGSVIMSLEEWHAAIDSCRNDSHQLLAHYCKWLYIVSI